MSLIHFTNLIRNHRLFLLAAVIIPATVFLIHTRHLNNEKSIIDSYQKQQLTTIHYLTRSIEARFDDIYSDLSILKNSLRSYGTSSEAREEIKQFYQSHGNLVHYIYLANSRGQLLYEYPEYSDSIKFDISDWPNFTQPQATHKPYLSGLEACPRDSCQRIFLLSLPLYDKAMVFEGVALVGTNIEKLWQQTLIKDNAFKKSETWVVDDNGVILYHSNPEYLYRTWEEIEDDYRAANKDANPEEEKMEDVVRKRIQTEDYGTIEYKNNLAGGTIELVAFSGFNILNRHFSSAIAGERSEFLNPINDDYWLMVFMIMLLVVLFILFGISSRRAIKARLKLEMEQQRSAEIQRLSELNKMIVESIPSPLAIINDLLVIEYINFGFTKAFNVFREPVIGKSIVDSLDSATLKECQQNINARDAIKKKLLEYLEKRYDQPVGFEVELLRKRGLGEVNQTLSLEIISISRARKKSTQKLLISITDITEPRRDEKTAKAKGDFLEALVGLSDMTEIARLTFDYISTLMPCEAGFIALLNSADHDKASQILYRFDTEESGDKIIETNRVTSSHELGANLEQVISQGHPIIIHRTPEQIGELKKDILPIIPGSLKPSSSLAYFPLKTHGSLVGVLSVQSYQYDAYGQERTAQLESISTEAALALTAARAAEALRENQRAISTLMGNLPGMAYRCRNDINWTMEFLSDGCFDLTGYVSQDFVGNVKKSYNDIIHPDDQARIFEEVQEALIKKIPFELNYRIVTAGNKEKWVWEKGQGLFSNDGAVIALEGFVTDITEHRAAEEALRASEERYRSIFEHGPLGIVIVNSDLRFVKANSSFCNMLGYSEQELTQMTIKDIAHPDDRAESLDKSHKIFNRQTKGFSLRKRYVKRNGQFIWANLTVAILNEDSNKSLFTLAMVEDITEKKRIEDALKMTQYGIDHADISIFWIAPDGRIINVNEVACSMLGYTRNELLSMSVMDLDTFVTTENWPILWDKVKSLGNFAVESKYKRKDGSLLPAEVNINYQEFNGQEYHFVFARDITELRDAQETLRRLGTAVDQSAEAIVISDEHGIIQYVNPAFENITGYKSNEAIGQNPRILKSNKHELKFYKDMWDTISQGETWKGHIINKKKSGELYEEDATISPIRDAAGKIINYVSVKRDVTQEVALENQLRHSQKLEAIGQLAGGIAHDFNNLLTAINGYSELILERLDDSDPMKQDIEEIKKAGERAASLTRQLLAFSRRQMLQPKLLNLNSVVVDMNKMMQRVMGENIDIKLNLAGDLWNIKADISQVEQIIMNLGVNARDAMLRGGKLIIETSNVNFDDNSAKMPVDICPGKYVKLAVSDTGCGMDEKTRSRIFEPFFTTKDVGKGTGLGLSTVYGIVQQSGGQIIVESEVGIGTIFGIYLPRSEDELGEQDKGKNTNLVGGGTETILLVEDEDVVRDLAFRILSKAGYIVLQASHPAEAIDICSNYELPIHILITDVIMPYLNGKEVYERVLISYPQIKVLFMSGHTDKAIIQDGALDSSINFIAKPFKMNQLLQKVRETLLETEIKSI